MPSKPRVFAVGDINVDIFVHSDEKFVPGEEHKMNNFYYTLGGNAANFAFALSSLGNETYLASIIGKDIFSHFIEKQAKSAGVKTLFVRSAKKSGVSVILLDRAGERAILSHKSALVDLDAPMVERLVLKKIRAGDIVYFGAYFHLPKLAKGFPALLKKIRKKGAFVFFDASFDKFGKWSVKKFLRLVDVFFLNETESRHITMAKSEAKGIKWLYRNSANIVVLKKGRKGAKLCLSQKHCTTVPGLGVKAVNTTGAGDFFDAGFAHGLVHGYPIELAVLAGHFVASKKIVSKDYYKPDRRELEDFLRSGKF